MTLRNRVMMTPMGTNLANPDGSISNEHKNYYKLRAKGGTGLIVVENVCVALSIRGAARYPFRSTTQALRRCHPV